MHVLVNSQVVYKYSQHVCLPSELMRSVDDRVGHKFYQVGYILQFECVICTD